MITVSREMHEAMEWIRWGYASAGQPDRRIYTFNRPPGDDGFMELKALSLIERASSTWVPGAYRLTALGLEWLRS